MKNKIVLICLTGVALLQAAPEMNLNELIVTSLKNSYELQQIESDILEAGEDLTEDGILYDSRVTAGQNYSYTDSDIHKWNSSLSWNVPLSEMFSVTGNITADKEGKITPKIEGSAKPFKKEDINHEDLLKLRSRTAALRYKRTEIAHKTESLALNLLISSIERDYSRKAEVLEEKKYSLILAYQKRGKASFQEVQDELLDLTKARQEIFNKEISFLENEQALKTRLMSGKNRTPAHIETEEIIELTVKRSQELDAASGTHLGNSDLEQSKLELTSLKQVADDFREWEPDLTLSANVTYSDPLTAGFKATFTYSPSDRKTERKTRLQRDITDKQVEIERLTFTLELERDLTEKSLQNAGHLLEITRLQEENSKNILKEALLLYEKGKRTAIQIEELQLNREKNKLEVFKAACSLYKLQGELLLLYSNNTLN